MRHFEITASQLHWLEGIELEDRCLHGHAVARIGERILERDCTVSATGLYLLKSLTEDHILHQDNQMLPCCGHFMIPSDDGRTVAICGCPEGIDWTVRHEDGAVQIILEDGYTVTVPYDEYCREVLAFAGVIEEFYNSEPPRVLPEDDFDRKGYRIFWEEWHRRKADALDISSAP